jgi:hypothetical protein
MEIGTSRWFRTKHLAILAAVVAVAVTSVIVLILLTQQQPESQIPVLLMPALASETYTYRDTQGMLAVLESSGGLRFEVPHAWLPGDAQVGSAFRVTTEVQLQASRTTLGLAIEPNE